MAGYPLFSVATVLNANASTHTLNVVLASGQVPAVGIRVLTHGPADAVTISHKPLPRAGTRGAVCFIGGDPRNGIWLGSFYATGNDSLTSDTDPNLELDSHWSGAYELLDGSGNWTKSFPDGTYIQSASTTTKPVLNRHIINPDQSRSLTAFPDGDRIPNPPSARPFIIHHASGATIQINTAGDITINAAGSNTAVLTMNAAGTVTVHASNTITLTAGTSIALHAPAITMGT